MIVQICVRFALHMLRNKEELSKRRKVWACLLLVCLCAPAYHNQLCMGCSMSNLERQQKWWRIWSHCKPNEQSFWRLPVKVIKCASTQGRHFFSQKLYQQWAAGNSMAAHTHTHTQHITKHSLVLLFFFFYYFAYLITYLVQLYAIKKLLIWFTQTVEHLDDLYERFCRFIFSVTWSIKILNLSPIFYWNYSHKFVRFLIEIALSLHVYRFVFTWHVWACDDWTFIVWLVQPIWFMFISNAHTYMNRVYTELEMKMGGKRQGRQDFELCWNELVQLE